MSPKTEGDEATDSTRREEAAFLVADDRLPDEAIATKVGISKRQLERWKKQAKFSATVAALRAELRARVFEVGIADKAVRVRDYQDLRQRLWATIVARAESAEQSRGAGDTYGRQPAPGAEQGLMVKKLTLSGKGLIEEWAVDTAVIAEIRNLDKQAAQEMGEWTERKELTGKDGGPLQLRTAPDLSGLSDEELDILERVAGRFADPGRDSSRAPETPLPD